MFGWVRASDFFLERVSALESTAECELGTAAECELGTALTVVATE